MNSIEKIYYTALSLQKSKHTMDEARFLHTCRMQLDPFVFDHLKLNYGGRLEQFWNSYTIPLKSDKAIVFVERRCHPNFEFCLQNAVYFARGYAVHIFCSQANLEFIERTCGNQLNNIHIHKVFQGIGTPEQGKLEYNRLLKEKHFWETLQEEHILTFETDCYLLRPIPESIYTYDYIASKWGWVPQEPGGGGLSYRKRSMMLAICEKYSVDCTPMQDCFASEGAKALGYKYPSFDKSSEFFLESMYSSKPIGVHQWWTFLCQVNSDNLFTIFDSYLTLHME
jgi:hypothetical protein